MNCRTCGKPIESPYRRYVNGRIVEGCIAEDHTIAFKGVCNNSATWHFRKEAEAWRKENANRIRNILKG